MLCLGTAEHKDVRWARDVALTPLLVRVDIVYMWVRALMFPLVGRGGVVQWIGCGTSSEVSMIHSGDQMMM